TARFPDACPQMRGRQAGPDLESGTRDTCMADHRFIIVDDHPLLRGALGQALRSAFASAEVLEAGSLDQLTERLETAGGVDPLLPDLRKPRGHRGSGAAFPPPPPPQGPVGVPVRPAQPPPP